MRAGGFRAAAAGSATLAIALAVASADGAARFVPVAPDAVEVEEGSEGAYLGIRLVEETEHAEGGARITHVVQDSPAAKAGLSEDDIVVAFDGAVIRGPLALTQRIRTHEPGDRVKLEVRREGRVRQVEVELARRASLVGIAPPVTWQGDRWEAWQQEFDKRMEGLGERLGNGSRSYSFTLPDAESPLPFVVWGKPKLGVELVETTVELREHLGGDEDHGVLVSRVLSGTPAERAGIRVGDLILSIDDTAVAAVGELRDALRDRDGKSFPVRVARNGKPTTVQVSLPEPTADRPTGPRARLSLPPAPPAPPALPTALPAALAPLPPLPPLAPRPPRPAPAADDPEIEV